jgi:hypothetical protein
VTVDPEISQRTPSPHYRPHPKKQIIFTYHNLSASPDRSGIIRSKPTSKSSKIMGDAFDGWGYSTTGFLFLIMCGLPLAILLLLGWGIHLFIQSRSPYEQIRNNRIRSRGFLLRSITGIVIGSVAGLIMISLMTSNIDDCDLFKIQLKRTSYSAEVKMIAQQKFQTMNCSDILKNHNSTLLTQIVLIITATTPSIGLICAMRLYRKS